MVHACLCVCVLVCLCVCVHIWRQICGQRDLARKHPLVLQRRSRSVQQSAKSNCRSSTSRGCHEKSNLHILCILCHSFHYSKAHSSVINSVSLGGFLSSVFVASQHLIVLQIVLDLLPPSAPMLSWWMWCKWTNKNKFLRCCSLFLHQ